MPDYRCLRPRVTKIPVNGQSLRAGERLIAVAKDFVRFQRKRELARQGKEKKHPVAPFPVFYFTSSSGVGSATVLTTLGCSLLDRKSTRLNSSHLGISYS